MRQPLNFGLVTGLVSLQKMICSGAIQNPPSIRVVTPNRRKGKRDRELESLLRHDGHCGKINALTPVMILDSRRGVRQKQDKRAASPSPYNI